MKKIEMNTGSKTLKFTCVADLLHRMRLDPPPHPMMALVDYGRSTPDLRDGGSWISLDFYKITFKPDFEGSVRYGPGTYDFKQGGMAFLAPGQMVHMSSEREDYQGYALYFHPDLLCSHPLEHTIRRYGFFDYDVSEALLLSEKEKSAMDALFRLIGVELENPVDRFSQQVLVCQLELLLNQSDRFYNRQFLTRKSVHHELIQRMNGWLHDRFSDPVLAMGQLPSPRELAAHLNVSQRYLSDMLKAITGKTTQQHMHLALIGQAKQLLNQTDLTIAEIAYRLGFEHPQSFSKLFRQRTHLSPAAFRRENAAWRLGVGNQTATGLTGS